MTRTAHSWVADGPGATLVPRQVELPDLLDDEVRVAVSHCSICMSDLDVLDNVFDNTTFPAVAGHEVIGVVSETGPRVSTLAVGQQVGVGPQRWSCGECDFCTTGRENLCAQMRMTPASGQRGGFSDTLQVAAKFAFALPAELDPATSAPLMCAGLTVFSPLLRHAPRPARVGILGVGGLGHLAVQFAAAMGHDVTAFTNVVDDAEVERLIGLGASKIVDTTVPDELRGANRSVDLIVSTVHGDIDFAAYVGALRPGGTLCLIGNTSRPLGSFVLRMIHLQRGIVGSAAGSRADMMAMLRFAADHGIRPHVEHAPITVINEQIERVRRGEPRYRVVLHAMNDQT